jgi:cell division protein FtsN
MPRFNFASKPAKQSNPDAGNSESPLKHKSEKEGVAQKDLHTTADAASPEKQGNAASDFFNDEEIQTPSIPMDEAIPAEYRETDNPIEAELSSSIIEPSREAIEDQADDPPADDEEQVLEDPLETDDSVNAEDFGNPFEDLSKEDAYLSGDDLQIDKPVKRSNLPLFGLLAVVVVLLSLSIIWYIEPFPSLKTGLESLFRTNGPSAELAEVELPSAIDSLTNEQAIPREWNFYLQISAFKELYKAQSDANRFRKLGLPTSVDGEFIPAKRSTYYKVRLGPFESVASAMSAADSLKDVISGSAFLDSIRVEQDIVDSSGTEPVIQPTIKKYRPRATRSQTDQSSNTLPNKGVKPLPAAASGYAVHVSSFKVMKTAQQETSALIVRGLPAYTTKTLHDGTTWYRVLVGPFRTQSEAKRYLEIVKKEFGNTAYVRDLSK